MGEFKNQVDSLAKNQAEINSIQNQIYRNLQDSKIMQKGLGIRVIKFPLLNVGLEVKDNLMTSPHALSNLKLVIFVTGKGTLKQHVWS